VEARYRRKAAHIGVLGVQLVESIDLALKHFCSPVPLTESTSKSVSGAQIA
jgi:hypothetical protein